MKFSFTVKTEPECVHYLKLLYRGKEYTLEDFSDEFKSGEFSLENLLPECTLIYKEKKITFEEYSNNIKSFSNSLDFFERYQNEIIPLEIDLQMSNYNYYKAAKFLEKAEECLQTARYYLLICQDILEYGCNLNWKTSYGAIFQVRTMNFKTAIIWYNNCFDYILQIAFLAFELYKSMPKYNSSLGFEDILRLCTYKSIKDLHTANSSNSNLNTLWNILEKCRNSLKDINSWANFAKHKGGIGFIGLKPASPFEVSINDAGGNTQHLTSEFESISLDLDDSISVLVKAHKTLYDCLNEIMDFIDFQKAIPQKDENDNLVIPDKNSYVKVIL